MSIDLLTQLKDLRLYGMSDAWAEIKAEAPQRQKELSPERLLRQLNLIVIFLLWQTMTFL